MIATVDQVTRVLRDADKRFELVGGSTRHYVRDVLLPLLEESGMIIINIPPGKSVKAIVDQVDIKRSIAAGLKEKGYSFRQIQKALGYKSVRSIQHLLK